MQSMVGIQTGLNIMLNISSYTDEAGPDFVKDICK